MEALFVEVMRWHKIDDNGKFLRWKRAMSEILIVLWPGFCKGNDVTEVVAGEESAL